MKKSGDFKLQAVKLDLDDAACQMVSYELRKWAGCCVCTLYAHAVLLLACCKELFQLLFACHTVGARAANQSEAVVF